MSLQIKTVDIKEIHTDPANARLHGKKNIESIIGSLRQFGQVEPLVVQKSTGKIIGGNGRLEAMKELGWSEVDVIELEIEDTNSIALGIALNRTSELATWDYEVLPSLLEGLQTQDIDMVGWDDLELETLLSKLEGDTDGDSESGGGAKK